FQAEDGIRDFHVTGVQTCALPILPSPDQRILLDVRPDHAVNLLFPGRVRKRLRAELHDPIPKLACKGQIPSLRIDPGLMPLAGQIGRASCRERMENWSGVVPLSKI